jgi:lipopolysaccharide/colanic/teichoic acid biosynthesis glycosyltransferase
MEEFDTNNEMDYQKRLSERTKIDVSENLRSHRLYEIGKRVQDFVLALIASALLFPFMLLLMIIICIDSPGAGPIFVQTRIGKDGKPFRFYKFRSMVPHAESMQAALQKHNEMDGPAFKMKKDPRITRVGRFIRKVSIDELPQLWNVLKGDMSLVGPRPALPREVELYTDYERQRLCIKPGLTCYWQCHKKRNDVLFDEWMDLDIQYIQERSFWVDWKIIIKTFGVVVSGEGI